MNPIDVKSDSYAKFNIDCNDKNPKFEVASHVRISKYKKINKVEIMINANVNVEHWLTKVYVINDLFGILAILNVNVINHVMLQNI